MKMFDPNDPRPLRIMIFPDKPQTILIHVPEGQTLWLPTLATPFDLDAVCKALDDRDVPHVSIEGDPGRWWRNATQLENEEKAERLSIQKQEQAERRVRITLSPKATTIESQRAELILEKQKADDEIRQLKAQIGKAKTDAYTSGTYLPPLVFQTKQQRLVDLQAVSLALQGRLAELRRQQKAQNHLATQLAKLANEEKAERLNLQKQEQTEQMVRITMSPKATTIERQRAELILEKQKADDEIRQLKAQIGKAKTDAYTSGTYLPPLVFQTKQQRLADLQSVSLALQGRLAELRQQQKVQNHQAQDHQERLFIEKAKRYLSREQYLAIWDEVHAELRDVEHDSAADDTPETLKRSDCG